LIMHEKERTGASGEKKGPKEKKVGSEKELECDPTKVPVMPSVYIEGEKGRLAATIRRYLAERKEPSQYL